MHKGPAEGGPSEGPTVESVFCFPVQNVVKSTEIYGFLHELTRQLYVLVKKRLNDQIVDLVTNRRAIHTAEVVLTDVWVTSRPMCLQFTLSIF